ncbi:MAG: hypothetical protein CVV03_03325 [Firmicutes bacterium HGW-Firmicutes-8]|nr:MAG: hypothetical protein CVV03_03325 [Firmicutes bacterium HGW-Firmicutes-8]
MSFTEKRAVCFLLAAVLILISTGSGCGKKDAGVISASGTVEATEINVNAETGGKVIDLLVDEGSPVKQGEVVGRIDSTILALQVQHAEAVLRSAQEKSRETKTGTREQLVAQARAAVQQVSSLQEGARQTMDNAKDNLDKILALVNEGGATSQQLSNARTQYETAKAQYEAYAAQKKSAQEQLDLLKSGATQETINIADAGVAQAQANLSIAKAQMTKSFLYAPINGIIGSLNFNQGEYAGPGAAVATIINTDDLYVNVYIPEKELPKIKLGQKAEIFIDAYPGKPYSGAVSYISSKAEFTPKNLQTKEERVNMVFAVKVKISGGKAQLKPGLPADITILTR